MGRGHGRRQAGRRRGRCRRAAGESGGEGGHPAGCGESADREGGARRAASRRMKLVMWDIDYTLLHGGGLASRAWKAAFVEVTGVPWQQCPVFGGRADLDLCGETFTAHGVTGCRPERFFARYVEMVQARRHEFA